MCGRYTLHADLENILQYYDVDEIDHLSYEYRYNIAPTQSVLSVVNDGRSNRIGYLKWGLVPSWANDVKIGHKMINARAETIDEKPAFKQLLSRRRCVIVGSAFYEWKRENGKKQPFCIKLKNEKLISFAGLWDQWKKNGEITNSCTILTTEPNQLMSGIHDRMPVILSSENTIKWLDRKIQDKSYLKTLLKPFNEEEMIAYQVNTMVNSTRNDGVELISPVHSTY
jgi:putative SOS response-associated peptidase YedK